MNNVFLLAPFFQNIIWLVVGLIIGAVLAFNYTKKAFTKQIKDQPSPINEKMIRTMYSQMGRKPSEKQVRQVMKSVEDQKNA